MSSEHTLNTLLELDHISKIYGDLRAVDDLTLTVPQGEWLAIVGFRQNHADEHDWLHGHAFKGFRHAGRPQVGGFERQAACRRA